MELRHPGHSRTILLTALLCTLLQSLDAAANNASDFVNFPQLTLRGQLSTAQQRRRQLTPEEQTEILTDIQEHHGFQQRFLNISHHAQPHYQSILPQHNLQQQFHPQEQFFIEGQSPDFEFKRTQQRRPLVSQQQPQQHVSSFQKPLDSFTAQRQFPRNTQFTNTFLQRQNVPKPEPSAFPQPSLHQFSQGVAQIQTPLAHSPQSDSQHETIDLSPPPPPSLNQLPPVAFPQQETNFQQQPVLPSPVSPSLFFFPQQPSLNFASFSNEPSGQPDSFKDTPQLSGTLNQDQSSFSTAAPEVSADIKLEKGIPNTEITIQRSISDPEELKKVQELELKRQQEQREFLLRQKQELQRLLQEQREREEKRLQEQQQLLSKILYTPDSANVAQTPTATNSTTTPVLAEKAQVTAATASSVPSQSPTTELKPKRRPYQSQKGGSPSQAEAKPTRSRGREEIVGPTIAPEEQVLLQNERQKLFYQLKERQKQKLQQQQEQQLQSSEKHETATLREQATQAVLGKLEHRRQQEKQQQQKQVQDQLQRQFQQQVVQRQDLLRQLKLAVANAAPPQEKLTPLISTNLSNPTPIFLPDGQRLQLDQILRQLNPAAIPKNSSPTIMIAELPASTTTQRPPRALFEELTKGVLPPGADFEIIRHKQDGSLEEVGKQNIPMSQKKVTFVFLEEQPNGSFKVRGVKGNANANEQSGESAAPANVDVDSIIKKLQDGDLKLPARLSSNSVTPSTSPLPFLQPESIHISSKQTVSPTTAAATAVTSRTNSIITNTVTNNPISSFPQNIISQPHGNMEVLPSVSISTPYYEQTSSPATPAFKPIPEQQLDPNYSNSPYSVEVQGSPVGQTPSPTVSLQQSSQDFVAHFPQNHFIDPSLVSSIRSSPSPTDAVIQHQQQESQGQQPQLHQQQQVYEPQHQEQDSRQPQQSKPPNKIIKLSVPFFPTNPSYVGHSPSPGIVYASSTYRPEPSISTGEPTFQDYNEQNQDYRQNAESSSVKTPKRVAAPPQLLQPLDEEETLQEESEPPSLSRVLRQEGLFAMARFLQEAQIDSILNDTGPYTVFAPTDKAFRSLLIQLGGPEKAEEKFKENPRLLSGLLLHHVIPGEFEYSSLQDEMTGVSLAGTQLRVNTYTTQDLQWNELQVVTINGARVSRDKRDIPIPQGIAHAVDRVMFPLPVGSIVQTLRSDKERRYSKFLRALRTAGLIDTLAGPRMYTVFAPVDRAFSVLEPEDLEALLKDRELARALVLRHVIPGTLYTAGMRFYQLRDSLEKGSTVTLQKTNGQLRANKALVITRNIPATNGVVHAIDNLM